MLGGSRVDGNRLADSVLQFMSDITPDGRSKDIFICRNCGWCGFNCDWHQKKKDGKLVHHFRCVMCFAEYSPWKTMKDHIAFNKVIVSSTDDNVRATPAWWTQNQEQRVINIFKEHSYRLQAEKRGESHDYAFSVTYETVALKVHEMISPFEDEHEYCFKTTSYPLAYRPGVPNARRTWKLTACRGFDHCTETGDARGFFFKDPMKVRKDQIFQDWDEIISEIEKHLQSTVRSKI